MESVLANADNLTPYGVVAILLIVIGKFFTSYFKMRESVRVAEITTGAENRKTGLAAQEQVRETLQSLLSTMFNKYESQLEIAAGLNGRVSALEAGLRECNIKHNDCERKYTELEARLPKRKKRIN